MMKRMLSLLLLGCAVAACSASARAPAARAEPEAPAQKLELDARYEPTPHHVVKRMLELAEVKPGERVYDLGAGDGRIVVAAAKQFDATAVGVEVDPQRIEEATRNAEQAGVGDRVTLLQKDLFEVDLRDADVVTLYLTRSANLKLRPKLWRELKPGARVVSHTHDMGDWKPDRTVQISGRPLYLWVIPAHGATPREG